MSRWVRVSTVLAAGAFVIGFRVHATSEDVDPVAAAATLNATRASAIQTDTLRKPGVRVQLADVAGLPTLQAEPAAAVAARQKKAEAAKRAKAHAKAVAERKHKQRAARKQAAARKKAAARKQAAARKKAAAKATPRAPVAVTPRATPQPQQPTYTPPTYTPPVKKKPYVGKDFDSKG